VLSAWSTVSRAMRVEPASGGVFLRMGGVTGVLDRAVRKVLNAALVPAGACILGVMVLIVVGVIVRVSGSIVAGVYELTEIAIVPTVGVGLAYTALKDGHIKVSIVTEKLPDHIERIFIVVTNLVSAVVWGVIVWANIDILMARWSTERSELLHIPYAPFRFIWVCGLVLFCIVFLVNAARAYTSTRANR